MESKRRGQERVHGGPSVITAERAENQKWAMETDTTLSPSRLSMKVL